MKTNIEEITEAEALALSPEQIDWLIKYGCAEEGIRQLPEPVKPEKFVPDYDTEVYEVHGMYFSEFDIAEIVRCCLMDHVGYMRKMDYNWQQSSTYKYVQEFTGSFSVERVKCFTPAQYEKLAGEMRRYEEEKRKYETFLKEYQEEQKKVQRVKDSIYDKLDEHKQRAYIRERSCSDYRSYLGLANGNVETARRFFEKAYPGANHQEVYGLVDDPIADVAAP